MTEVRVGDLIFYRFRYYDSARELIRRQIEVHERGRGNPPGSYFIVVDLSGDEASLYYKGKITLTSRKELLELLHGKHYTLIQRFVRREDHD